MNHNKGTGGSPATVLQGDYKVAQDSHRAHGEKAGEEKTRVTGFLPSLGADNHLASASLWGWWLTLTDTLLMVQGLVYCLHSRESLHGL